MTRIWSLARAGALAIGVLIACDSPLEPFRPLGQGERVPVDRLIEDAISGSVDRSYSFDVAIGGEYVVFLKSLTGFITLGVIDPTTQFTQASVFSTPGTTPLEENPSTNVPTPQGGVLLIRGHVIDGDTGRFQFKIYPVNTAPEIAPRRFEFGDTIVGETINPLVDTDVFTAYGEAGQAVAAALQPLGSDPGGITLYVETETGQLLSLVPAAGEPLMTTGPIPLSVSRDYRFVIRSTRIDAHPRHRGLYRVWSYLIHPAPEHVSLPLSVDTEVRGERIDHPNDVDEFTFQDTIGAEFTAFVEGSPPMMLSVLSSTNSIIAAGNDHDRDTTLLHHGTNPFQLTTVGTHTIRVLSDAPNWLMADTGAYRVILYRIDHRPESLSSVVQVGDTISGEAIYPGGDIDDFTVSATPGEQLTPWFRLSANPVPAFASISFEVFDPAIAAPLSQTSAAATGGFAQGATFTVPAGGSFQVRVGRGGVARAPYEFFLSPPPPP